MSERLAQVDWTTLLIALGIVVAVLLGPYDLLMLLQRRWERQRQERIARGEDVTPKRIPFDDEDDD
jgi:hypothetical protein